MCFCTKQKKKIQKNVRKENINKPKTEISLISFQLLYIYFFSSDYSKMLKAKC